MTSSSFFGHDHPSDRPPGREPWTAGATLSVLAHAGLVAALVWGVRWHTASEEGVQAELWSSVPQFAAPAPTSPPPPPPPQRQPTRPEPEPAPPPPPVAAPRPPDIVTAREVEKQRRRQEQEQQDKLKAEKAEKDKLAKEKADKEKADKAEKAKLAQQQKLDSDKLAKQHDDYMKRVLGQMDAPANATGTAARTSGPSANWAGKVAALIRSHLIWSDPVDGLKSPEIKITLGVDGTILSAKITASSGNTRFDDAVLRAVQATQTLPRDTDGRVPSSGVIVFNPAG